MPGNLRPTRAEAWIYSATSRVKPATDDIEAIDIDAMPNDIGSLLLRGRVCLDWPHLSIAFSSSIVAIMCETSTPR